MKRHSYSWWGWCVSCGIVLCIAVVLFVPIARTYHGTCGGFIPEISTPQPCSFEAHMSFYLYLTVGTEGVVYGPILVGVLLIPPLVGSMLDRRGRASVAQSILLFTALGFLAAPGVTWMVLGWRNAD